MPQSWFQKKNSSSNIFELSAKSPNSLRKWGYQITVEHYHHLHRTLESHRIIWSGTIAAFLKYEAAESDEYHRETN